MRRAPVAAVAVLALAGCGGSGTPKADPGTVAVTVVSQIVHNDYTHAWDGLLSVDMAVAPRGEYVSCESKNPVAAVPTAIKVLRVTDESVGLGNGTFVPSKAVAVRLTFGGSFKVTHTVHLVAESGKWKWILPSWRYRDYKANRCPSTTGTGSATPTA